MLCVSAALAGLALAGAAPSERALAERLGVAPAPSSSRYTCLNDLARRFDARLSSDELTGVWTVEAGGRRVAVAPGMAVGVVGQRLVVLDDEVVVRYGRVHVPRSLAHEIEWFLKGGPAVGAVKLRPPSAPPTSLPPPPTAVRAVARVCIDPGHGGKDPGAVTRGMQEKDIVLATSHLLAAELRSRGLEVVMTREGDSFVELEDRPAVASRRGADLFVAVHANAMPNRPTYQGLEIFYWRGSWSAGSAATRRESGELAEAIRDACVRNGLVVRSVRGADYKVLRHSRVPAVLVEIGFLTNRSDESALRTTAYRQRVAKAIADGIVAYRGCSR